MFSFGKKIFTPKCRAVIPLIVLGFLVIVLIYFVVLRSKVPTGDLTANTSGDSSTDSQVVKKKYPDDVELPDFVVRNLLDMPQQIEADFDVLEFLGAHVISTGNITAVEITDASGSRKLADAIMLEVYMDDKDNYLTNNESFNVVLRVYPVGDEEENGADIAPGYLKTIFLDLGGKELYDVLKNNDDSQTITQEETEQLDVKNEELRREYDSTGVDQAWLTKTFKEGTAWMISPYIKDEIIEYTLANRDSPYHEFVALANEYYEGEDSGIFEKILSKDLSGFEQPIFITDIYMTKESAE